MIKISLESARKNAGLTMKQASYKLGIHHETLSKYEKDSSNISYSLLEKMSWLYQIPTDYIFLGSKYDLIRTIEKQRDEQPA